MSYKRLKISKMAIFHNIRPTSVRNLHVFTPCRLFPRVLIKFSTHTYITDRNFQNVLFKFALQTQMKIVVK
jgi:hypothetical protein